MSSSSSSASATATTQDINDPEYEFFPTVHLFKGPEDSPMLHGAAATATAAANHAKANFFQPRTATGYNPNNKLPMTHFVSFRLAMNDLLKQHAMGLQAAVIAQQPELEQCATDIREMHITAAMFHIPDTNAYYAVVDNLERAFKTASREALRLKRPQITIQGLSSFVSTQVIYLKPAEDEGMKALRHWKNVFIRVFKQSPGAKYLLPQVESDGYWRPHITLFKKARWEQRGNTGQPPRIQEGTWKPYENNGGFSIPVFGAELSSVVSERDPKDGFYRCEYYYSFPNITPEILAKKASPAGKGKAPLIDPKKKEEHDENMKTLRELCPDQSDDELEDALARYDDNLDLAATWIFNSNPGEAKTSGKHAADTSIEDLDSESEDKKSKKSR